MMVHFVNAFAAFAAVMHTLKFGNLAFFTLLHLKFFGRLFSSICHFLSLVLSNDLATFVLLI